MQSKKRHGNIRADTFQPADASALLARARALAAASAASPSPESQPPMQGRRLALIATSAEDEDAVHFHNAATALGAHVSFIEPRLNADSSPQEIEATGRMLGQLYEAVECQQLPPGLVRRLAQSAGIPVFAGIASRNHPSAELVQALEGAAPAADKRRYLLQAALLLSIP